jgi:predicted nucleotidyltransferase
MIVPSKIHNTRLVKIQPEERLAVTSEELLEKLEENIEHIKKYGVKRIGLFGSYVRNEQKSESDIDILVKFERGKKTFDNYMDLKFFLEDLFNRKVDLVVIEALKPDLKQYILGSVKYAAGL